jgi:hypothetical protein
MRPEKAQKGKKESNSQGRLCLPCMQHRLGLSPRQLSTVTWPEVARRIVDAQKQTRLCIARDLSEVDVVARIMRKENYLIGLLNKAGLAVSYNSIIIISSFFFSFSFYPFNFNGLSPRKVHANMALGLSEDHLLGIFAHAPPRMCMDYSCMRMLLSLRACSAALLPSQWNRIMRCDRRALAWRWHYSCCVGVQ